MRSRAARSPGPPRHRGLPGLLAGVLGGLLLAPTPAGAAPPISASGYRISVEPGPVFGAARVVGLAGAFAGVAEGADGIRWNPAAAGNRMRDATYLLTDWDLSTSVVLGLGDKANTDFDGDGRLDAATGEGRAVLADAALAAHFDRFGLGAQTIVTLTPLGTDQTQLLWNSYLSFAIAIPSLDLVVAPALHVTRWGLTLGNELEMALTSAAFSGGLLWRPRDTRLRVGLSFDLPAGETTLSLSGPGADQAKAQGTAGGLYLPGAVVFPGSLSVGVSYRLLGPTANPLPRAWGGPAGPPGGRPGLPYVVPSERYLLVAADVTVIAPVDNAYAPGAFFDPADPVVTRGEPSFVPRLGAEGEVVPGVLRLRGGAYLEPRRFEGAELRPHGTLGLDVRVGKILGFDWRVGAYGDVARRYQNGGLTLGFWS